MVFSVSQDSIGPIVGIIIWMIIGIAMIFGPCLCGQAQRRLCLLRIRQRRLYVHAGDLVKECIANRLSNHTKTIEKDDIVTRRKERNNEEQTQRVSIHFPISIKKEIKDNIFEADNDDEEEGLCNTSDSDQESGDLHVIDSENNRILQKDDQQIDSSSSKKDVQETASKEDGMALRIVSDTEQDEDEEIVAIRLPIDGIKKADTSRTREVDNECAICLNNYKLGERITWSGADCVHAFHEECMLKWLMTVGRTASANRRKGSIVCDMKFECPLCKQSFISESLDAMEEP